jgi:hypothetical protein
MTIIYGTNQIVTVIAIKFLGLITDDSLSWKGYTDWLMSRLGSASYAIRAIKPDMSLETMIYFMYFHSVMTYGMISWGELPLGFHIFRLQKKKGY